MQSHKIFTSSFSSTFSTLWSYHFSEEGKLNFLHSSNCSTEATFIITLERFSIECRKQLTNSFGLSLLHSVIGSKFSRPFFNQSEVKPKPIVARSCTFSRALCQLRVITSSFDWFRLSPSFLIGQSNYFGFGFTTLD